MTLGILAAIRAIVATHARYNRDHLLAHLDAAIERVRASQPGIMRLEEERSMVGQAHMKTASEGGVTSAEIPRRPRHQRTGLESSDD